MHPTFGDLLNVTAVEDKSEEEAIREQVGKVIRQRRNGLGISQEALADAARITRTHMGEVERGKRNLSLSRVVRIANALELKASELLGSAGL